MESKARNMEQSSLLERLQQLLHQSLQSNLAKTVSTGCPISSNRTWLHGSRQPPGIAVRPNSKVLIRKLSKWLVISALPRWRRDIYPDRRGLLTQACPAWVRCELLRQRPV